MRLTEFAAQLSSSPVIICLVIQLVKCVQCADYRTFDVGDGLRQIPKQDSIPSGLTLPQAQFASRTGSLDIRSRYWSKTRRDEYPEEQEDDPYYSAPSQTDGEDYAHGQSEFHTSEPHVTVDREDNEHTVTINMPRMERTGGGDHMIKKFVIQPVIQYVVQYDKRAQREPREDMSGTQYEEYEGVEGQERLRSDHEGRVDRLFNDVNTNFDGYWGNDEHGGGNNGGGNNYQDFQNGDNTGANFGNDFGGNNAWSAINQQNQAPGVDAYVSWGHDKNNNNNNNNNPGAPSSSFVPSSRGDGTNGMSLSDAVQVSNAQQQQQPGRPPSRQDDGGGTGGNQMGMMEGNQMDVMGGQGGSMMGESMSNAMPQNEGYSQNTEGMGTSMNYGPSPQPRPTYGPPGMIPGEPMGETPPQMMMPMQSAPQMPMQMQPAPQMPIYQAPQMPMSTAPPMPIYQAPQMPMPTTPPMPIYQAPQMPMSTAPPMPLYQAPQMSMSTVPQMQMHVPQPQQMIQAPQPHPQVKEISASVNFGVSNYGPPPPPSSNYGPPAPPPPSSNYGPPAPQPPSNYGPPAPQPPPNYGPPAAQTASNYGPPAPQQPPSNYGPPSHSQPSPTYGPPETTSQHPTSNAAETEGYGSTSKPTQTDSGGGYNEGGYGPEEHPKGWKGRKPGHDGRRPKRPRGGKGFMHSIRSLPKLPASIGGHLSFMFSTGFGKGRRGRGKPGGGWDGKNGSNKTSIDKEQVSDHILNILGLTVNHPREHSLNISENSTNPMLMWEQLGNQSSLDHLSQLLPIILVQGGTPEDTKTTTLLPATETTDVEDKVASGSSSSSTAAFITNNQTDVVIMEPETVHNDSIVTTATVNSVTQSNQVPMTASLNEAERQVRITLSFNSSTSTTTQLPLMTTTIQPEPQLLPSVPPTLITTTTTTNFPPPYFSPSSILPPLTTIKSPLSRVNTSTIPLPLTIKNYQTLYPLPPHPRQGRIQRPPTTPSPQKQLFPMRNTSPPPPHFPTPYDPVQENININLSNNILHLEEPYVPPKNSSITKANILAYYTEPSFGDPTLIKFDPLIYDALQAAFRNDNTYYFHDGITRKRKRSRLHIPIHNIDVRSRSNFDKLRRVLRKN